MTRYREFFSHVVDVVEGVGATILVVGGHGAFGAFARIVVNGVVACQLGPVPSRFERAAL